jgi:ligand-binding sensor domain-containing protein
MSQRRPVQRRLCVVLLLLWTVAGCGLVGLRLPSTTPAQPSAPAPIATAAPPPDAPQPTPRPPAVTAIAVTPDGAVWYAFGNRTWPASGGGLERLEGDEVTVFTMADGLPDENVQVLAAAPDGTLWVGAGCHVARFADGAWEEVGEGCEHAQSTVLDIAFDPGGAVWVAAPFALWRVEGDEWTSEERMADSLAVDPDGLLWVAGWTGEQGGQFVARFDGEEWRTFDVYELFAEGVRSLVRPAQYAVCGATSYHGVVCFDGDRWLELSTEDGLPSNRVLDLAVAPDGVLWAVTDVGVAHLDEGQWRIVEDAPERARVIAFGPDGATWFGTASGPERLDLE